MRRQLAAGFALLLPLVIGVSSCASTEKSQGLTRVDDLLTRVEQVQIESLVAREKASAAFEALGVIVAPDFQGDPMTVYGELVRCIDESKAQAKKLEMCVEPMKRTAEAVFHSWTADLEKFGNTNLRQQSQSRLAETRSRYSAVHDAAVTALVSINAFNADLGDQALFLEHDFNVTAVTVIASEVPALTSQARDLGRRLNACVNASKAYIASSALRGQMDAPSALDTQPRDVAGAQPARRASDPISGADGETVQPGQEAPTATTTAPARRRPRTGANPLETPEEQAPPTGATQPTSQPAKPAPDSTPKPTPEQPIGGGNR